MDRRFWMASDVVLKLPPLNLMPLFREPSLMFPFLSRRVPLRMVTFGFARARAIGRQPSALVHYRQHAAVLVGLLLR